ncbi:MAG: nicotinate-nucleotide adenylyltransferase [Tatlockia sp.]|nr:nicotinate-nucleotide adenylyltransferase [Tatlockia sp.]
MRNLIIYGGTFDPIHYGHIQTAINVQNHFKFDKLIFLPCKIPVLKNQAIATAAQRIQMLELAIAPYVKQYNFALDLSEINRETPSFMVDSLQHFRKQYGNELAITLLMGEDTFNQLPRWHQWLELIHLSNILVIHRAGFSESLSEEMLKFLQKHETIDEFLLMEQAKGLIYRFDAGIFNFSSSWIRQHIQSNKNLENYLPESVIQFIKQYNLYS